MPVDEAQGRLRQAEGMASDAEAAVSSLKRENAANVVAEVNILIRSIKGTCQAQRSKYPDISPIEVDNRADMNMSTRSHTPTLIAYCLALANRIFDGASRRSAGFILKMMKLFGLSLTLFSDGRNQQQMDAIEAIPDDIRTLEHRFNLDIGTFTYAVCPKCSFTHAPSSDGPSKLVYPQRCLERPTANAPPCNTPLLKDDHPLKRFEYYPFFDWFGRFLALPGVRQYGDQFCDEVRLASLQAGEDRKMSSDGHFFWELKGPGDKLFITDRGTEGRWLFTLYGDFFNIEGNRIGGKHSSTGIIALSCVNLPITIRNDPAYVYVSGLIQGPHEPDATESHHRHYLKPLVNDLLDGYIRGIRIHSYNSEGQGGASEPYARTERLALAALHMDFKAARPFSGHLDVNSHVFCHFCDTWHKVSLLRTDCEVWGRANDDRMRDASRKWLGAETVDERKAIETLTGARYSELLRLPYWRTSAQVVVDPMHAMYLRAQQQFWRIPLGLDNPSDSKVESMPAHRSEVAFYHNFTPPPPLSSIGVGSVDVEEEVPVLPSPLELNGLLANINQWRLDQLEGLRLRILTDKKAFAQVSAIERELSRSSSTNIANAREKLESNKWVSLFYVSCNVQAFGTETWEEFSELPPGVAIEPKHISKKRLAGALVEWRQREVVQQDSFIWPDFTTRSTRHFVDHALSEDVPTGSGSNTMLALNLTQRGNLLAGIAQRMTYNTAVGIGHIHRALCEPIQDNEGRTKLTKKLQMRTVDALSYVCIDVGCFPSEYSRKDDLVRALLYWRYNKPLDALSWPAIDSSAVLHRIHQALEEVIIPTWTAKPPYNVGRPMAGTLKADTWRVLFEIYVPLALLSLWKQDSPSSAANATEMAGVLETSMYMTCASLNMAKRSLTLQDRKRFRECWRRHIQGIKENFPGFSIPSHHLIFHIYDYMDLFGPVHNFWCFPGEKLIGKMQDIPSSHKTGQFESTLLHSYHKGARFRQWLLFQGCPGLFRDCVALLDRVYNGTSGSLLTDQTDRAVEGDGVHYSTEANSTVDLPSIVIDLFTVTPTKSYRQVAAPAGCYAVCSTSEANSYVCFRAWGSHDADWNSGRIEYIVEERKEVKLVIRRSLPPGRQGPDPFSAFWNDGFECKLLSTSFSKQLEVVDLKEVTGHAARWKLSSTELVVLRRVKASWLKAAVHILTFKLQE